MEDQPHHQQQDSNDNGNSMKDNNDNKSIYHATIPIVFKDQTSVSLEEMMETYGEYNPFVAYMDGCSMVVNHSDRFHGMIAALCDDLQHSFPFAYANTYITPPSQQTVPAHADDRDVFVFQIVGRKQWDVYQQIPIPYPYPQEQIGKASNLPVPTQVLDGPKLIDGCILKPGDVLYMPRGYIHKATACYNTENPEPSFHITVALATHDWTMAGLLTQATDQILKPCIPYRKAISREFGMKHSFDDDITSEQKHALQTKINDAIELLKQQITPQSIHEALHQKFQHHREGVALIRRQRKQQDYISITQRRAIQNGTTTVVVVGREAAGRITLTTRIRLATADEKAMAVALAATGSSPSSANKPRGLHVSDTYYDAIMEILQTFRSDPTIQIPVQDMAQLLSLSTPDMVAMGETQQQTAKPSKLCKLLLLSFARQCVELGALAIVND